jgi:hypothetical protein
MEVKDDTVTRRMYFSFHYQDVIDFRANVVRNHWVTRTRGEAGFFDASIWGTAKLWGDAAVKRLIDTAMVGTSVTCVLVGSYTYSRQWVRYEILESVLQKNAILAVHINSIAGKDGRTQPRGPNPLEYLALSYADDGQSGTLWERVDDSWQEYRAIDGRSSFRTAVAAEQRGNTDTLAQLYPAYDWSEDSGCINFSSWVNG